MYTKAKDFLENIAGMKKDEMKFKTFNSYNRRNN